MNRFYVYMYLDLDNIPFYIGKGKDQRYNIKGHLHKNNRNSFLKNKIRKVGVSNVKIHFLHKNISEKESFSWESYWIKYIGRRDLGTGTLCNLTDGGEGTSGIIFSEKHRRKIGEIHKGKKISKEHRQQISNAFKGIPRSEEIKQKMRGPRKPQGPLSEEHKRKIGEANKGKPSWNRGKKLGPPSKEHKRKISEALQGRKLSEDHKSKLCKSHEVLSNETVRKVRKLYRYGVSQQRVADTLDITQSTVSNIVNYKTYKYVK